MARSGRFMLKFNPFLGLLLAPLLLAGCATPTNITNLTPRTAVRNANGLYPVEVEWKSRQQTMRRETIKPAVMIGNEFYPMRPAPLLKNRWETLIPLPVDQEYVHYRIKFDYDYNSIPVPRQDSKLSPPYQLRIVEK